MNIGAVWLLIGLIIVTFIVDLIIPAAIAKWALLAPIFIPLFIRLGVAPQTVLAAYRVGDSPFNVVTPLMAYFPLIVVFTQRYKKDAGIGTVVSLMLPYVVILSIAWTLFFVVWYLIGIPLGPGLARAHVEASARARPAAVSDQTITFLVLAAVVVVFVLDRLPVAVVAVGTSLSLWATGVLDLNQALAGFGDPAVLFIASLFVVSESLDATGVTAWAGQMLIERVGESRRRLLVLMMLLVAVLTALISVNGAVAALLPVMVVVSGVLTIDAAYRGIAWTTVVLVAGMIPLSTAMTQTGAAARLADALVRIVGDAGPYALLLGLFVLTAVLGQLISNMATALIVFPVALSAARDLDVSARPVLMCVTVSAAAALLTPVATPANLMVMEPGGYRFGDYWKLGLPLLVLYGLVAVLLVPVFWRF